MIKRKNVAQKIDSAAMIKAYKKQYHIISTFLVFSLLNAAHANKINDEFMKAVYSKNYTIMTELLENGADINAQDKSLSTPLAVAAGNGDLELVTFLLRKGAILCQNKEIPYLPLYLAIANNHHDVVSELMKIGISPNYAWPNKDGGTLLITAVQFGNIETTKLLIELGADVNFCGNGKHSPLYRSVIYDHFNVFELLLSRGALMNRDDIVALTELKWWGKEISCKYKELL